MPPTRYRIPGGSSRPLAPPAPAIEATSAPHAQPVTPGPGWGWRTLVAFVVGGVLTAVGFTVAQLADTDTDTGDVEAVADPETSSTTAAPVTAPAVAPSPLDPGAEPALLVAESLGPSVVQIETNFGIGSGVVYADGLIITNHHVVDGAISITVQAKDGRRIPGTLVGSEPNVDIAVVSVGEGQRLAVAPLATGESAQVGQIAIAIGSPFRLQQTVTEGIVSAVNRPVPTGGIVTAMIQTDAPINPGNSGGALADRDGRVIGINTAIQTDSGSSTNAGIGFAIPIDTAVSVADRLVAGIPIEAGFLGVSGGISPAGAAGVEITAITAGSAADTAGLRVGDLIVSIDDTPVTTFEELAGLVVARAPDDVVVLDVVRDGQPVSVEATLGARSD